MRRFRLTRPDPTEADVLASVLQYLALLERTGRWLVCAHERRRRPAAAGQ